SDTFGADSKISEPSGSGVACGAPQCSHRARVTTRGVRHLEQGTRAGHSWSESIKTRPAHPRKKPSIAQPMHRAREKAYRRASQKQPSALPVADKRIKPM